MSDHHPWGPREAAQRRLWRGIVFGLVFLAMASLVVGGALVALLGGAS